MDARRINRQFFRLMQAHFWEASPAPVKAVLQMLGRAEDVLRLPMVPRIGRDAPEAGAHGW